MKLGETSFLDILDSIESLCQVSLEESDNSKRNAVSLPLSSSEQALSSLLRKLSIELEEFENSDLNSFATLFSKQILSLIEFEAVVQSIAFGVTLQEITTSVGISLLKLLRSYKTKELSLNEKLYNEIEYNRKNNQQILAFEDEIRELRSNLSSQQQQSELSTKYTELENELKLLSIKLTNEISNRTNESNSFQTEKKQLTSQLEERNSQISNLQSERNELQKRLKAETERFEIELQSVQQTQLANSTNEIQQNLAKLTTENNKLQTQINEKSQIENNLSKEIEIQKTKIIELNEQIQLLNDQLNENTEQSNSLVAECEDQLNRIQLLSTELDSKTQSTIEAQSTCEDLMDNLSIANRKNELYSKEIMELKEIVSQNEFALKNSNEIIEKLENTVKEFTSQTNNFKLELSNKTKLLSEQMSVVTKLESNLTELKTELQQTKKNNSEQQIELIELRQNCVDETSSLQAKINTLQSENNELQELLDCERMARRSTNRPSSSRMSLRPSLNPSEISISRSNSGHNQLQQQQQQLLSNNNNNNSVNSHWGTGDGDEDDIYVTSNPTNSNATVNVNSEIVDKLLVENEKQKSDLQNMKQQKEQLTEENSLLVDKLLELQNQLTIATESLSLVNSPVAAAAGSLRVSAEGGGDDDLWNYGGALSMTSPPKTPLTPGTTSGKLQKLTPPPLPAAALASVRSPMSSPTPSLPTQLSFQSGKAPLAAASGSMTPKTANTPTTSNTPKEITPLRNQRLDQQFTLEAGSAPLIVIEIGSFMARISQWNPTTNSFQLKYQCRTMKAVALNDSNRFDVVRFASSQSDRMFQKFREEGKFVGTDAYYVCFDHPDRGLRGSLKPMPIITANGTITDLSSFDQLIEDLLLRGAMATDASCFQVLFTYKLSYKDEEMSWIIQSLFEKLQCNKVCLLNEPVLLSRSIRPHSESCVVVDIGEMQTRVYVFYEGMLIDSANRCASVGGNHMTDFIALLLHAQQVESYSTLLPRRCKEVAREVKEKHSFVAIDFMEAQELYGYFEFESVRVMRPELLEASYQQGILKYDPTNQSQASAAASSARATAGVKATKTKQAEEIRKNIDIRLPDGVTISFGIDVERFNCTEVLFMPMLFEDCRESSSIIDEIVAAINIVEEDIRSEVCSTVILCGGSSTIPGLAARVESELRQQLPFLSTVTNEIVKVGGCDDVDAAPYACQSMECGSTVIAGAGNRLTSAADLSIDDEIDTNNFFNSLDYETDGSAKLLERLL